MMTKKSAIVLQWSGMEAPLYLARGLEMIGYNVILSERSNNNWRDHVINEILNENPPEWFFCPQRLYDPYDIEVITADSLSPGRIANNPRKVTKQGLRKILQAIY